MMKTASLGEMVASEEAVERDGRFNSSGEYP